MYATRDVTARLGITQSEGVAPLISINKLCYVAGTSTITRGGGAELLILNKSTAHAAPATI
jgi:hypothetical protein